MKIYLRKRSCFTFRGRESYELDVLGKTVLMLMRENLCAEICDDPPEGDKIVLDSVYPLLTRKKLEEVIKNTDGSFSFAGGETGGDTGGSETGGGSGESGETEKTEQEVSE